jgi:hypothetical protein
MPAALAGHLNRTLKAERIGPNGCHPEDPTVWTARSPFRFSATHPPLLSEGPGVHAADAGLSTSQMLGG